MTDMIERVACAMQIHMGRNYAISLHSSEWRLAARTAIEAMREPTFAIVKAGFNTQDDGSGELHRRKWQAMITAALEEAGE